LARPLRFYKADVRRHIAYAEAFQRDFGEHRLRPNEEAEEYALYAFLNPFRARLVQWDEQWPGWFSPEPNRFRFLNLFQNGMPPREWADWPEDRFGTLQVGE
jgi:hypothetical protein